MTPFRMFAARALALAAVLSLSACGGFDTATRNATDPGSMTRPAASVAAPMPAVRVVDFRIDVPRSLTASEANLYYPLGDIVWRGDAPGDRHVQVAAIFEAAMRDAVPTAKGEVPVVADITLVRFHAVTEKAEFTVGGVHSIRFMLTLTDPATGAVIAGPRLIEANLRAYGGARAIEAERLGLGQKTRITRHLANVIATELARPGSVGPGITTYVAGLEAGPLKL